MTKTEAITFFKGIPNLARALDISYSAVSQWEEEIPRLRQHELEKITGGALRVDAPIKKQKAA